MDQNKDNRSSRRSPLNEEMTKTEITNIVMTKLNGFINDRKLEKKIKQVAADVIDELFKTLWQKRSYWKNDIRK